jgi:ketosteroid isomerase-like protein
MHTADTDEFRGLRKSAVPRSRTTTSRALPSSPSNGLIVGGDTVVAPNGGSARRRDGEVLRFVFSDVFTFTGDLISRLETHQVNKFT